jgi:DNA primase
LNTHRNAMPTPQHGAAPNGCDDERVRAILAHLDHAGVPESKYPDTQGEYWALCPFHDDKKPTNFSFSAQQGAYKCFACGAQGHTAQLCNR